MSADHKISKNSKSEKKDEFVTNTINPNTTG